jgi:hypothetical protein
MRLAGGAFLQEERLLRGASPRVKAVLFPFDLDYGLGPGSGTYENTQYGGEPGALELVDGDLITGSWTSPVMQTFSPYLDTLLVSWVNQVDYLEVQVFLRGAAIADQVAQAAYSQLWPQEESPLFPFFQVRVEFQAIDPEGKEFPTGISQLSFEGRLTIPESDILNPGKVNVELIRDFGGLKSGSHILGMDNRQSQWLPTGGSFYFLGLPWEEKRLALYHGFDLPGGSVAWLLLYQGALSSLGGMADGWQERHRVELETKDWISHRLNQRLGAPTPEGERQPFMRGFYRSRGELLEVTPAEVSSPVKNGSSSATLKILGDYRGDEVTNYLLQIETTGEVGTATFRWSTTGGQSWEKINLICGGAENPVTLEEGLAVYWQPGIGNDLVAGDNYTFTAQPPVYHYRLPGGPFEAITTIYLNGEATWEDVDADPNTGNVAVTGRSAQVSARVVKDGTTHPVDIILDILAEVGLGEVVNQDSFDLAKSVTPEYTVGVCFENIPASQALRELLRRSLYDLWVDFGEIKIRAYLGED